MGNPTGFKAALKCEITGSENRTRHIWNTINLFISLKGLYFGFEILMVIIIIKTFLHNVVKCNKG